MENWDWTATFTLVLACVTFLSVVTFCIFTIIGWKKNQKLWQAERDERLLKEAKERKEKLLKEIIDWGESIRKSVFTANLAILGIAPRVIGDARKRALALQHENECHIVAVRYTYLKTVALELDVNIQNVIENVSNNLVRHLAILDLELEGKTTDNDVPDSIDKLKNSVVEMIKVTASFLPK